METILLMIVIGLVIVELIEHLFLPLFFLIKRRREDASAGGVSGMIGKVVEVKEWHKDEGRVSVDGALWKAVSDRPLGPRSTAVIRGVKGLTLEVELLAESSAQETLKDDAGEQTFLPPPS